MSLETANSKKEIDITVPVYIAASTCLFIMPHPFSYKRYTGNQYLPIMYFVQNDSFPEQPPD